ncbi:MAG TPA: lamin tail domain-containing protein, partial [Candidatus Syntrophosphaera sp.]|nr:lamin tail domain-containing protein [Candidatus Syntrophosphaera sp.]
MVINEVCYDPLGVDAGFEWIELYNAGGVDLNLEGALILSGGSTLQQVYVLPNFILRTGRYLLIGEAQIAQAVYNTPLGFQNGGSETDGIRFVAPDGSFTDTVLYDSPNLYGLPDDSGNA